MYENGAKVSIVLPTYNGAKYIRQSIDSCLNQTYKNIELIVVDDGSSDETSEIIRSYKDGRIRYLRHEGNKGMPHALNTGFAHTTGEYLTWTSDDNFYAKEAIEKMLTFLKTRNCEFVYCDYCSFEDDNFSNLNRIKLTDQDKVENSNCIGCCFLYSRRIKELTGAYNPNTELAEDYDYWIRVSKKFSMHHLSEPLYFYRLHDKSLSVTKYYEVRISDYLVRLNNDILGLNQVGNLFVDLIAQKSKGLLKVNRVLAKILFSKKINRILTDMKMAKISFEKAKLRLQRVVSSKLIEYLNVFVPTRPLRIIKHKLVSLLQKNKKMVPPPHKRLSD